MFKKPSILILLSASSLASFSALAAVPESVTTAVTESLADVGIIGAAVLAVMIAIVGFNWLRRLMH